MRKNEEKVSLFEDPFVKGEEKQTLGSLAHLWEKKHTHTQRTWIITILQCENIAKNKTKNHTKAVHYHFMHS